MKREQRTGNKGQDTAPMRTRVKICGITNTEDAQEAIRLGADALGFIFVLDSPRYIYIGEALDIIEEVPAFVTKVAVCMDCSEMIPAKFHAIQYYTNMKKYGFATSQGGWLRPLISAYRICDEKSLEEIEKRNDKPTMILLDTYHKDKLGGSGETFNWDLALEAKQRFGLPIILAGGLTPENVGEAIAKVRPYAVDVSSGVEAEPGRKDHAKLVAFFRAVREADARNALRLSGLDNT